MSDNELSLLVGCFFAGLTLITWDLQRRADRYFGYIPKRLDFARWWCWLMGEHEYRRRYPDDFPIVVRRGGIAIHTGPVPPTPPLPVQTALEWARSRPRPSPPLPPPPLCCYCGRGDCRGSH